MVAKLFVIMSSFYRLLLAFLYASYQEFQKESWVFQARLPQVYLVYHKDLTSTFFTAICPVQDTSLPPSPLNVTLSLNVCIFFI